MRPEEIDFPFSNLPPVGVVDDFEIDLDDFAIETFNNGSERGGYGKLFCSSLDQIFEFDSLGDGPTSDEHIILSPPFGPVFKLDPKFDEEFNFWKKPNQLFEQEHFPVEPWPEEGPRRTTSSNRNRSPKPGYIQTSLDDWIEKMKRDGTLTVRKGVNSKIKKSKSAFLYLAGASIPPQARQEGPFLTLNFELHGREKVPSFGKRAASARHEKGMSCPLQKKLKCSCFKPVTNPAMVTGLFVDAALDPVHFQKK